MSFLMRGQLRALSTERLALMSRASMERARLRAALEPADALAAKAARVRDTLRAIGRTPLLIGFGAAALLLAKLRPASLGAWVARGLAAWRLYEEMRRRRMLT